MQYLRIIYFFSEIKSFCELPFIDEIKMLPPGTYWLKAVEKKYYNIPKYFVHYEDSKIILTGIKLRLIDAVHKRIPSESKKIACLLSGGIDSSIITYITSKYHNNVEAFTFANPRSHSGDLESAKLLYNMLNIKHIIVSPTEQELKSFYLKYGIYMSREL